VAFTGGMAIGEKWAGNADSEDHWRDTMVKVTGPLAASVQSAFTSQWANAVGEILVGDAFYPTPPASGDPAGQDVTLHLGVASSPNSDTHPLRIVFTQTFLAARKTLYITTPYFVPDRIMREAVAKRARSGVDVRLLLPDEHTDAKPIRQATHSYLEELLEAGVRVYEYQPTMIHTKHVVVDGQWSVVGSANMDIRSKEINDENVLGILDAGFARELEATFLDDLKHTEEIRLDAWRKRGPFKRVLERTCRLFVEQY
jgi:cardiolipin synthase